MKTMLLMIAMAIPALGAVDHDRLLMAISELENPTLRARGQAGERGPYHLTAATWRRYTARPFSQADDPGLSHQVARRHLAQVERVLARAGVEVTPASLAMAWNCGEHRVAGGRVPAQAQDYGRRAANLYQVVGR